VILFLLRNYNKVKINYIKVVRLVNLSIFVLF